MRVLTFLHSFEPGGVERIALRLVRHWRTMGMDAPLLMGRDNGAMHAELAHDLDYQLPPSLPVPTAFWETLWMILVLPLTIRRLRPDVLFCAGNSYAIVAVAMKMLVRRCPPVVLKISNDLDRRDMVWPLRRIYWLWLRIQGRMLDHFVGMEEPMRGEIAERLKVAPRQITIIPDPALSRAQIARLRAKRRCKFGRESAEIRFVAVGRLARQKNIALMLESFAQGAGPLDHLTIYGDGADRRSLERMAVRLGIRPRVDFAGHVSDPASRLAEHDIFLLSSDYEGVPAVLIEALAAGLPIIATDCSRSIATLLDHGRLGCIVPTRDVAAFANAITQAAHLRQSIRASRIQAERFTLETASGAYLDCFRAVAGLTKRHFQHCGGSAVVASLP